MLLICFWTKKCISPKSQNAQHVRTCLIQNWIQGGQSHLKTVETVDAYPKATFIGLNNSIDLDKKKLDEEAILGYTISQ